MARTLTDAPPRLRACCDRKELHEAVQMVAHAVSGRTALPILSHVLIQTEENDRLRLTATDLELGISLAVPARGVEEAGGLTAPARLLSELLSSLPDGQVSLSVDLSHAVRVHCGKSDYKILGLPAEEYPRLPEVKDESRFTIPQAVLRSLIRKTIFAVSPDEARAILTGILVVFAGDTVKFVATDTHRLAVCWSSVTDGQGGRQAIVPARAMNELMRLLEDADGEVTVRISENQILFLLPGGVELVSRLIEGQFPNYERVIPARSERVLTLETQPFLQAVKRAAIVARSNANRLVLSTLDDRLAIRAESSLDGSAYEEVDVIREGDDIEIAFNAKYLADVAGVLDTQGFRLEVTEPLKPGVVRPVAEPGSPTGDYLCVLMPMQIV